MNGFILVIWTVVAIHGSGAGNTYDVRRDWRELGVFYTEAACQAAAKNLGRKPDTYRCVSQRDGSTS